MYARCFATILSLNLAGAKQHAATAGTAMNGTEQIHAGPREDAELQQLRWELAQARAKAAEAEANAAAAQRAEAQAKQALDDALATQATGELYGALFSSFFLLAVLGAFFVVAEQLRGAKRPTDEHHCAFERRAREDPDQIGTTANSLR
mmetsp:Transcript_15992/g.30109  ORF Transcript_15992/g.30109 Transcript_15992/m.30109 type:complete len:149 (-) Transcript_15992:179-625(-)